MNGQDKLERFISCKATLQLIHKLRRKRSVVKTQHQLSILSPEMLDSSCLNFLFELLQKCIIFAKQSATSKQHIKGFEHILYAME